MGAAGTPTASEAASTPTSVSDPHTLRPADHSPMTPSSAGVSARMARQRRRDTGPETALRRRLFAAGERFRVGYPVPGMRRCTIDIAFPRRRVAVFVDGCFWHRCTVHGTEPTANGEWWTRKLDNNVARDRRVDAVLAGADWTVVRVWEHEPSELAAERVLQALAAQLPTPTVVRR